jgi:hypothetical protein
MRLFPRRPPPESNAWLILGITGTLLGIAKIYGSIYPSKWVLEHPGAYHNPTILEGVVWLVIGLTFLIPAIKRKFKKQKNADKSGFTVLRGSKTGLSQ